MRTVPIFLSLFATAHTAVAQSALTRAGQRSLLPRAQEIALARSAAPASVTTNARVLVFSDSGFVVADSGSNGVSCIVNRSWPKSLEPHCFDAEASVSILPMEMERTRLFHRGVREPEVERAIREGLATGRFRLPQRPAMSYMMSEAQRLIGDDGADAGHWRPHVMVYYPHLTNAAMGFGKSPDMLVGMVSDEGRPDANLTIVVPQFVSVTGPRLEQREPLARPVFEAESAFAHTLAARDAAAFGAYVALDAVFFGRRGPVHGRAAVVASWQPFFEGPAAPFSWSPEVVEVLESGTLALSSGPVRDPAGRQIGTFNSIWRRDPDGRWRVVFDKGCPLPAPPL